MIPDEVDRSIYYDILIDFFSPFLTAPLEMIALTTSRIYLKGMATLMITMLYMKDLNKP